MHLSISENFLYRLKLLDWFDHCSLQIGDRLFYRIKNDDKPLTLEPKKAFNPNEPMTNKAEITINYDASGDETKNKEAHCVSFKLDLFLKHNSSYKPKKDIRVLAGQMLGENQ